MSNKAKCPYCKQSIDTEATKCPWCHSDTSSWARKNKRGGCLLFIVIAIIVGITKFNSSNDESSSNKSSSTKSTSTQQVDNIKTDKNKNTDNNKKHTETSKHTDNSAEYDGNYGTIHAENAEHIDNKQQEYKSSYTEAEMSELEKLYQLVADIRKTDFDKASKDKKGIIQKVSSFKNTEDYESVILFVIENNKDLSKNWEKNKQYFSSQIEFYEAYISSDYKEIIKARKM